MNLVVLDTGTLGMVSNPKATPENLRCREWARSLVAAGHRVVVPEIADYEVRRELIRAGKAKGVARLDLLRSAFHFAPLTGEAMLLAAELWADVRRRGMPTAPPRALDGDAILAAQALVGAGPDDTFVVATDNVGHLHRFPGVDAREWHQIAP
jgi:predicted nucleic acid-binding protein